MNKNEIQVILTQDIDSNAIHYKAQVVSVKEFKELGNLTVGNMHDITYENPDKLNINAHKAKKSRLTHKFVMFYTYNMIHKVICSGSLEQIAAYIEQRIRIHDAELAIVNG